MTGPMYSGRSLGDDEIRAIASSLEAHDAERIAPPAAVWDAIAAELEVEIATSEAQARRSAGRAGRRWFTNPGPLLLAAASILIVGLVAVSLTRPTADDTVPLATAQMTDEGLPVSTTATATAQVICDDDGCVVDVDLTEIPSADAADLELWVINADVSDMHSLGFVTESARFDLPDGVSATDFPIVDISIEPRDGDASHSGQSVLRGVLSEI